MREDKLLDPGITLFFDGSCLPVNPGGKSCYGWVLKDGTNNTVATGSGYLCEGEGSTNNVAEYGALTAGLRYLLENNYTGIKLTICGDRQLVMHQVADRWKCKKPHLQALRDEARRLLALVSPQWHTEWVPRHLNTEADELSMAAQKRGPGSAVIVKITVPG
jgi:ribonuclease HI